MALSSELLKLGCQKLQLDPAMFIFFTAERENESSEPNGMLVSHVDNLLHAGDNSFEVTVIEPLKAVFAFGSDNDYDFRYVGLHIEQVDSEIYVDQNYYFRSLDVHDVRSFNNPGAGTELGVGSQTIFRSVVGKLTNISFTSRPDLCFFAKSMSSKYGKATLKDVKIVVKKLVLVKSSGNSKMFFPNLGDVSS